MAFKYNCSPFVCTGADTGFPFGGGWGVPYPVVGRQRPMRALVGENVCENERIGSYWGQEGTGTGRGACRSAPWIRQ